jgi:hypothetical protein
MLGRIALGGGNGSDPIRSPPGRLEVSLAGHGRASGHVILGCAGAANDTCTALHGQLVLRSIASISFAVLAASICAFKFASLSKHA